MQRPYGRILETGRSTPLSTRFGHSHFPKAAEPPERRGCAFQLMSPQIYGILARAAVVSCNVNARSVSVRMLPSDPTE